MGITKKAATQSEESVAGEIKETKTRTSTKSTWQRPRLYPRMKSKSTAWTGGVSTDGLTSS